MTSEQFIKAIEDYYGKYRIGVKKVVKQYLTTIDEEKLSELRRHIILTVSTRYGHIPDVATIEDAINETRDIQPDYGEYRPMLPDPEAGSMKLEVGELMKTIIKKIR